MKKLMIAVLLTPLAVVSTGCSHQNQTQAADFTKKTTSGIRSKAKTYSQAAYQSASIPAHSYVRLVGKVVKTDAATAQIRQGDRFVLQRGKLKVQVFHQAQTPVRLGQTVTVYGEYYGFVKGYVIDQEAKQ
ncbi:hypothetical protein [Lacticaseibacillus jixiensis]|uniref:hypothetical protein n=1 Tax=Lacticaseibacillus jixiensis TaxID=3231926 RepID=UPI0036F319C2